MSSQAGVVLTVNRLVTVRPFQSRYIPEVGDVVVGRVVQVANKRWMVDINAMQHASLLLSAVTLPQGVQRRRTYEDELNMRSFFTEGDPISAEIQEIRGDGTIALHTRSQKFGLLRDGLMLKVSPSLIARAKKHYVQLPLGVSAILGTNGSVWLSPYELDAPATEVIKDKQKEPGREVSLEAHGRVAKVGNAILLLNSQFVPIDPSSIATVCEECEKRNLDVKAMCLPEVQFDVGEVFRSKRMETAGP